MPSSVEPVRTLKNILLKIKEHLMYKINGKKYHMHQCFVSLDWDPLFFSVEAKDGTLFIVECIDTDENICYACETTEEEIFKMLDKQITMREMFLNKKDMYEIKNGKPVKISEFDPQWLPYENKYYEIYQSNLKGYYEILKERLGH